MPRIEDVNLDGVVLPEEARARLLAFDADGWRAEIDSLGDYLDEYGGRGGFNKSWVFGFRD